MTDFNLVSRSKFIVTAGLSAEPVANINPEQAPIRYKGELDGYDVQLAAMLEGYPDKT